MTYASHNAVRNRDGKIRRAHGYVTRFPPRVIIYVSPDCGLYLSCCGISDAPNWHTQKRIYDKKARIKRADNEKAQTQEGAGVDRRRHRKAQTRTIRTREEDEKEGTQGAIPGQKALKASINTAKNKK